MKELICSNNTYISSFETPMTEVLMGTSKHTFG